MESEKKTFEKIIQELGYTQLYIGGGLTTGLLLVAFGAREFAIFVILGLICLMGFYVVHDATKAKFQSENLETGEIIKLASAYYGVYLLGFFAAFMVGALVSL